PARTISDMFDFGDQGGQVLPGTPQFQRPGRRGGQQQREIPIEGAGSGFIIDKDGYILTNNHVVEDATEIEVKLSDMKTLEPMLRAKLIGRDLLTDSALIQLVDMPKHPLTESKFGDSSQVAAGDWVMAIGNPFRLSSTVTVGVVSAVGRTATEL